MNIFISATNTNIGKTTIITKLIKKFSSLGLKVGVFKPIETGVQKTPMDGKKLLTETQKHNPLFADIALNDVVPVQFSLPASPIVAGVVDFGKIDIAYNKLKTRCDILLIEGAGGIMVPVTKNFYMFDFIEYFNAKSILVVQGKLGCINDLELNLNFFTPDVWGINLFDDSFYKTSYPYLVEKYKEVLIFQKDLDKIAKKILEKK